MVENQHKPVVEGKRRKKALFQILLAVVILVSGTIIGSGATVLLANSGLFSPAHHEPDLATIADKIQQHYSLTDSQRDQVKQILVQSAARREDIRGQMIQQLRDQRDVMVEQMRQVLTPEQFDSWHEDFQAKMERFERRHEKRRK